MLAEELGNWLLEERRKLPKRYELPSSSLDVSYAHLKNNGVTSPASVDWFVYFRTGKTKHKLLSVEMLKECY